MRLHRLGAQGTAALVVIFALTGCMARLTIDTRIYNREWDYPREVAGSVTEALESIDSRIASGTRVFARVIDKFRAAYPDTIAFGAEEFSRDYAQALRDDLRSEFGDRRDALLSRAAHLGAIEFPSGAGSTRPPARALGIARAKGAALLSDLGTLVADMEQTIVHHAERQYQELLEQAYQAAATRSLSASSEALGAASDAARAERIREIQTSTYAETRAQLDESSLEELLNAFGQATVIEPVARAAAATDTASRLSHSDPEASRIVSAPENRWRATYNDAGGRFVFGNSEIAVRLMPDTRTFHVKSAIFDPSQVTAATVEGIQSAVSIAAAATGEGAGAGTSTETANGASSPQSRQTAARLEAQRRLATIGECAWRLADDSLSLTAHADILELAARVRAASDLLRAANHEETPSDTP